MHAARHAWLRSAATSVRTALTAASLTLLLGLGTASVISAPQSPTEHLGLSGQDAATNRLLDRHNCSTTGFQPDVIPTTAVIRDASGRTRLVTFDEGWAVFKNERPGDLVAVCLGSRPTSAKGE